ncbi:uncharacterized protein LY79DRAFT_551792 [Colletotrichum navitas]|uniref:BTB domain-containing protein n=1 Tax=Colletotrichum navitas TaxID=681940 RepID=A0AAD8Q178_9PEZI|nr:uncharacterized protein LY79DRAFT_551792 [Colletotrichum navitas]KAK1593411.1 hypothetical protein LY79DRAFT_551792 [Colletotrichum navitas]
MESIEETNGAFTSGDELAEPITQTIDLGNGSGDVTIILRYFPEPDEQKTELHGLIVSSEAMARASPVWKQMFAGQWAETKAGRRLVLDHREDDYKAVVTIMNIIHLRFNDVPQTVTPGELKAIATFTDQRMATALVVPWIERWLKHLSWSVEIVGYETEWLWVAWEFGLADVFDRVACRLAYGAPVPVAKSIPQPSMAGTLSHSGEPVYSPEEHEVQDILYDVDFNMLPPGVEGK